MTILYIASRMDFIVAKFPLEMHELCNSDIVRVMSERQRTDEEWDALIAEEQRKKNRKKLLMIQTRLTDENPEAQSRGVRDGWFAVRSHTERGDDGTIIFIETLWEIDGSGFFRERRNPNNNTIIEFTLLGEVEPLEVIDDNPR
ncbi:hypothetical protein HY087_02565 [Candidatus Gottesmanbacteria bacterium]|nr:hypothetical protein [Candidatus Gottesmanbacteria bacterium]